MLAQPAYAQATGGQGTGAQEAETNTEIVVTDICMWRVPA